MSCIKYLWKNCSPYLNLLCFWTFYKQTCQRERKKTHEEGQWTLEGELTQDAAWAGLTEGVVLRAPPCPRLLSLPQPSSTSSAGSGRPPGIRGQGSRRAAGLFIVILPGMKREALVCERSRKCRYQDLLEKKNIYIDIYLFIERYMLICMHILASCSNVELKAAQYFEYIHLCYYNRAKGFSSRFCTV